MKHQLFAILILLFTVKLTHAQSPSAIDSLLRQLKTAADTNRVNVFVALCKEYRRRDIDKSLQYGNQALELAQKLNFYNGVTSAMQYLSNIYSDKEDYLQSLNLRLQLYDRYRKNSDALNVGHTLNDIGRIYHLIGNYPKAFDYYFSAARQEEKINDAEGAGNTLHLIGLAYEEHNNDSLALKYFLQSLDTYEKSSDYSGVAIVSTSLGELFQEKNNFGKTLQYFQKAYNASKKIPSREAAHAIATSLLNLSSVYKDNSNFEKALAYNDEVLKIAHQFNSPLIEALSLENFARIYYNMNRLDESNSYFLKALYKYRETNDDYDVALMYNAIAKNYLQQNEYKLAEQNASCALQLTREGDLHELAKEALEILTKANTAMGNYAKAFDYQQKYISVKDSLVNEEKSKEVTRLEMLYETEKKEKEIALLKSKTEKEEILRYVMGGSALLIVIIAFFLFKQQRTKNKKNELLYESQRALSVAELNNARLQQNQLQRELEFKTKELTTSALNFIQKNSMMQEIKDKIREIQVRSDTSISKELNKLQLIVDHSFNLDSDWDEFRMYFEQVHHNFLSNLKKQFPDLTNKELRLCALLRLNMNIKETTSLLGISAESVKVARYRLRKKLGLITEENLTDFLMHIENGKAFSNGVK